MDWALLAVSVALVAVTGGLVYFTWGIVDEARKTRAEMRETRREMEEARRLSVRPHLTLEPVMLGPVYAFMGVRNLGPGAARDVSLQVEFEPVGDVRYLDTPVILPGGLEQFILPDGITNLDAAQAADLVFVARGRGVDIYGERFSIDLRFEWGPWVEKLTDAQRRSIREPDYGIVKALKEIAKGLAALQRGRGP